jgi:starch phosphorylase
MADMPTDRRPAPAPPGTLSLRDASLFALRLAMGRESGAASDYDRYRSLALAVRERLMRDRIATEQRLLARNAKSVHYLSLEFLMGRTLQNAILNLDVEGEAREVMSEMGKVLEDAYEEEHDAGLGNGGLGRLAACFLDSLATLGIPACGYGIRYEYGIFNQVIEGGRQVERPDYWLFRGNPWETARPEEIVRVRFHGRTRHDVDPRGRRRVAWVDTDDVLAMPFETLVPGYRNGVANPLILWSAEATEEFNLEYFNDGDYVRAVEQKQWSETISKVLYPRDESGPGKELRLKQQYFFVSASLQRILRELLSRHQDLRQLPDRAAIHLNDTHPAVAVPELMRILVDEHEMPWDEAWDVTTRTFAYTNHTLMPEALERWGVSLFGDLLPRHLEIVYEINRRFLDDVESRYPGDGARRSRMSLIDEGGGRSVRMANLAIVGGHSVNGVAALHTDLLKRHTFRDFHEMWPERFSNKTNGVTQRRWLLQANPALARLITESIGPGWVTDLDELAGLAPLADDAGFRETWAELKHGNKSVLAASLRDDLGVEVDPSSLFDVQVKRIHEYKRQLLNVLRVAARYLSLRDSDVPVGVPRTVLLGGKAAPGYRMAKLIIEPGLPRRAHLPGQRPLGADLDRGHRGLGHRQHEVRAERRADHRDAGRGQHRDPGRGGSGQHLHLRADRGGGDPTQGGGLLAVGRLPRRARDPAGPGCGGAGSLLARRAGALPPPRGLPAGRGGSVHGAGRLRVLRPDPGRGRRLPLGPPRLDRTEHPKRGGHGLLLQ